MDKNNINGGQNGNGIESHADASFVINDGKPLKIHPADNVAVRRDGHKVALRDIRPGENVVKYGFPIGHATQTIKEGEFVHSHNLASNLKGLEEYVYEPEKTQLETVGEDDYFDGYVREGTLSPGGERAVGIRNEIWIIPTVGCVNNTAATLARLANRRYADERDSFFAFTHPFGCSQLGDDHETTQKILAGLVAHPNAAGVLVLGLGCENNNITAFRNFMVGTGVNTDLNPKRVKFLNSQDAGDEIEEGLRLLGELWNYARDQKRTKCSVSRLIVGLKCGGSDAFSGLTANPAVGVFSDMLIARGGSGVLTEVPEMFGAETILMKRAADREVFGKIVNLINSNKSYYMRHGQPLCENPSPGNKAGGITTLEEKSLGCVQKGGTAAVSDVIGIGDRVRSRGLTLLDGPGNDMVACTNLTAAGCHFILFTTGRGTPFGSPVPTVKISSNPDIARLKPSWIDFDASSRPARSLFDYVLKVASGEPVKNELHGYREISIFKDGITL